MQINQLCPAARTEEFLVLLITVAAPLIAAASNQKIFSGHLVAAAIQERPLIEK